MKNQHNKATVKDGLPTAEETEHQTAWNLIGHPHQIADTGDYDGHYEITNGKISLLTQDDDDESLQPIVDALNNSGCKFYQNDWFEFENKMLKDENAELDKMGEQLSAENSDLSSQIEGLKAWKESAMRELNALDLQSLGRELGIGLGQSVSENIHAKVDGLMERVKELEAQNKRLKIAHYTIVRAYEEYGPLASVSTKQVSENVLKEIGFDPSKETL